MVKLKYLVESSQGNFTCFKYLMKQMTHNSDVFYRNRNNMNSNNKAQMLKGLEKEVRLY
jgi:hypothetical protein